MDLDAPTCIKTNKKDKLNGFACEPSCFSATKYLMSFEAYMNYIEIDYFILSYFNALTS